VPKRHGTLPDTHAREEEAMSDENLLTRREFTVETALAMLAGITITISGCGDDDDDNGNPTNSTPPPAGGESGTVSTNAGHSHGGADITAAQLTAGSAIMLTLTGSGHTHTVALSQADMTQINAQMRVDKTSSNDNGHTHTVTFNG
jgi:hypothetical protein